jgi:sugar lactone lactonase YvrE
VIPSNSDTVTVLATLPFFPSGLAIDNKRGWIYVSNSTGNEIDVYNLAGKLLHIIK